MTGKWIKII